MHLRQIFAKYLFLVTAFATCRPIAAATTAFVYSATNQFGIVDLSTGAYIAVGSPDVLLSGIASLSGPEVFGVDYASNLVTLDLATAQTNAVGDVGLPIISIEGSRGVLYGQTTTSLYSINPSSANTSLIGDFGAGFDFDFAAGAFDAAGNLFEVGETVGSSETSLYSVNASTGAATLIGPNQALVESILFEHGQLYGFSGVPGSAAGGSIVSLNTNSGLATFVAQQDPALSEVLGAGATSASVPEPGAGSLMAFGAAALFLWRLRKKLTSRSFVF